MYQPHLRTVSAIRYVTPLREGGSLPAIVEADDDGTYVLKFRGAGHGDKALIAELLAGEMARALGLPTPELVLITLDAGLGRAERDPEIRSLIHASDGLNLGVDYLPGAIGFEVFDRDQLDPLLASAVVWFDAFISNVDRTARNPNLLFWKKQLWLIDHGAAFYFHYTWRDADAQSNSPFAPIKDHVLLPAATLLSEADSQLRARLSPDVFESIVALIPSDWLDGEPLPQMARRAAYVRYLRQRLEAAHIFVEEARRARAQRV